MLTSLIEHCLAPKKVGWCRGSFPRWFYNPSLQKCEEFIFGGCKPNKNNYLREDECTLACKNVRGESARTSAPSLSQDRDDLVGRYCSFLAGKWLEPRADETWLIIDGES